MPELMPLLDKQGNKLEPVTLGECVTMGNGDNLDVLMSKNQMFTPTITQDKSMFKVGTGVDVDYSANVKDGAYENLVFKGKSLVNLLTSLRPDTDSNWVRNGSSFTLNASGVLFLNYSALLKPNTTYTVVGELDFDVDGIVIGFREGNKSWEVNLSISSRGRFAVLISTSAESTSNVLTAHRAVTSNSDRVTLSNLMVLEGDWTNAELPTYFEGLGSCKMPILRNVGKNLYGGEVITNKAIDFNIGELYDAEGYNALNYYTQVSQGSTITISNEYGRLESNTFILYNSNKEYTGFINVNGVVTIPKGVCYVRAYGMSHIMMGNIQIEESSYATTYESYKTNILRTSEEIVLRGVDGVQDTYNGLTGEYVKRIEECVLDGSQALSLDGSLIYLGLTDRPINNSGIADKVPVITVNQLLTGEFGICMQDRGTSGRIYISIEGLTTREEILQYLRTNPITVQYELVEPITTIIKPYTTPFAYQNGHVILESGYEGQSLLPEIEYGVVTGRTGQVVQNSKILRKHEQQISSIEDLLLTQIVEMDYERLLLQFDYDLQMLGLSE